LTKVLTVTATVTGKFDGLLQPSGQRDVSFQVRLGHQDIAALVGMGPTARHVSTADLTDQIGRLPGDLPVTVAVTVSTFVKT
jgi:23S rRNA (guanine745-N1)-methyltransferase